MQCVYLLPLLPLLAIADITRDSTSCTLTVKNEPVVFSIEPGTNCESYSVNFGSQTEIRDCNNGSGSRSSDGDSDQNGKGGKLGQLIGNRDKRMAISSKRKLRLKRMLGSTGKDRGGLSTTALPTNDTTITPGFRFAFDLASCSCAPAMQVICTE